MKVKIKKTIKEIDKTEPPQSAPPRPEDFPQNLPQTRGEKYMQIYRDEKANIAAQQDKFLSKLQPKPLEPDQMDLGFEDEDYYDPENDPLGPLQEIAKRHFKKG